MVMHAVAWEDISLEFRTFLTVCLCSIGLGMPVPVRLFASERRPPEATLACGYFSSGEFREHARWHM